jgi:dienelactone hydrolase
MSTRAAHINVDRRVALFDSPVAIIVSGLDPGERVTLTASATGCSGFTWMSNASFTADPSGNVDLATEAPTSGSYQGRQAMGLLWSLTPRVAFTTDETMCVPSSGLSLKLLAEAKGKLLASLTLTRLAITPGVREQALRPSSTGFYGDFFAPPTASPTRPGVLIFGGSEGGLSTTTEAGLLASHGYPTLALAYFGEPGLSQTMQNIPLKYFVTALRWLAQQPGVDSSHLVVDGVSRGSEAALLLGADFPQLVHAVIALVPSDVALCGIVPVTGARSRCAGPAWTLDGNAVPYTNEFGNPYPTDQPHAVIQVEHIDGPILLDCGGDDLVWPSCSFAEAIQQRLAAADFTFTHELLTYADAGHGVGYPAPYDPTVVVADGGTSATTELARENLWPIELAFLAAIP